MPLNSLSDLIVKLALTQGMESRRSLGVSRGCGRGVAAIRSALAIECPAEDVKASFMAHSRFAGMRRHRLAIPFVRDDPSRRVAPDGGSTDS